MNFNATTHLKHSKVVNYIPKQILNKEKVTSSNMSISNMPPI